MNEKISNKDKRDWQNFISSKDKIKDKDQQSIKKISVKENSYRFYMDIHWKKQIKKLKNLFYLVLNKVKKINIITGKGSRSKNKDDPYQSKDLSILKYSVPNYIKENKNLMNKISKNRFQFNN